MKFLDMPLIIEKLSAIPYITVDRFNYKLDRNDFNKFVSMLEVGVKLNKDVDEINHKIYELKNSEKLDELISLIKKDFKGDLEMVINKSSVHLKYNAKQLSLCEDILKLID